MSDNISHATLRSLQTSKRGVRDGYRTETAVDVEPGIYDE